MKLRKLIASVAAGAIAVSAMFTSASAASIKVVEGADPSCSIGTGMWLVQVYNIGTPEENKPATDYGLDLESIAAIEFEVLPTDGEFEYDSEADDGTFGGGLVMSCGKGVMGDDSSRNWNSAQWWGLGEVANPEQDQYGVMFKATGTGTLKARWDVPEEYRFLNGVEYAQIALQEWGSSLSAIEVKQLNCYDTAGNIVIAFDGLGNKIDGSAAAAPAAVTEEAASDVPASTKGNADTGAADVAIVIGVAALAAGAVVISRKRK